MWGSDRHMSKRWVVPTGKVKWYDAEKGFGFLSDDEGTDVFLHADALPQGITTLKGGTRVEFGVVEGRRGAQALSVRVLDPAPSVVASVAAKNRTSPEDLTVIIEDVIKLLDSVSTTLHRGKYPDKVTAAKVAKVLHGVASQLETGA
jgi:CspA family cold shock protein